MPSLPEGLSEPFSSPSDFERFSSCFLRLIYRVRSVCDFLGLRAEDSLHNLIVTHLALNEHVANLIMALSMLTKCLLGTLILLVYYAGHILVYDLGRGLAVRLVEPSPLVSL